MKGRFCSKQYETDDEKPPVQLFLGRMIDFSVRKKSYHMIQLLYRNVGICNREEILKILQGKKCSILEKEGKEHLLK